MAENSKHSIGKSVDDFVNETRSVELASGCQDVYIAIRRSKGFKQLLGVVKQHALGAEQSYGVTNLEF